MERLCEPLVRGPRRVSPFGLAFKPVQFFVDNAGVELYWATLTPDFIGGRIQRVVLPREHLVIELSPEPEILLRGGIEYIMPGFFFG